MLLKEKRTGTWCTIKSNSLDGVPIYDEAGGSVPIGSLPEGKLCELTDSTIKEGKKWGKVKYAGLSGWMKMSYLKYICQESISIQEDSQIYINVSTEKGIRMYQEPDVTSDAVLKGIPYGAEATVDNLVAMRNALPQGANWGAFGIGREQYPMLAQAVIAGGNDRVGLEDNIYISKGEFATNEQLVEKAVRLIRDLGANVLSPAEARKKLGILK